MKRPFVVTLVLLALVSTLSACGPQDPAPNVGQATPIATHAATPTVALSASPFPEPTKLAQLTRHCSLLDSRDVASLYPAAEVMLPTPEPSEPGHVIFSTDAISGAEHSCMYYVFYHPSWSDNQMLQITYWISMPGQTAPELWAKAWEDADAKASQQMPGIGDDAFYNSGRLTFKRGNAYVTIEVKGTHLETSTPNGVSRQIEMERQMALDILSRLN